LMLAPSVSFAQQSASTAYAMGRDGNPVKTRTGDCVRTRFWTPAASHPQCGRAMTPAAATRGVRK
jgi:hypothetical protein